MHLLEKRESRIFMHSPSFGMLMERNVFSKCFNPMLFSCLLHVVSSFLKNSKFIQSSCSLCSLALNKFYVRLICFPIIFCCIRVPSPISSAASYISIASIIRTKDFCLFFLSIRFRLIHYFWLLPSLKFKDTINILFLPYQAID